MRIYFDLNCFNRPFDDQTQPRIASESRAIETLLRRIVDGDDELVWSAALCFENSRHPLADRRDEIGQWAELASIAVDDLEQVRERAEELQSKGLTGLDAIHVACAESAGADRFLTCDDRLVRRASRIGTGVTIRNPVEHLAEVTDDGSIFRRGIAERGACGPGAGTRVGRDAPVPGAPQPRRIRLSEMAG